jgi:hypothetical protein
VEHVWLKRQELVSASAKLMEKKQLNSNVVSAAQLLSGFASVQLISASHAIK